jgi:protein required for attachment to host cells
LPNIVRIPKDVTILVCDATKALLLRNAGDVAQPELQVDAHLQSPPRDDAVDNGGSPGRRFDGGSAAITGTSRSAMEAADPEAKQAEAFAGNLVSTLNNRHQSTPIGGLIIVAPPSFLGMIRQKMNEDLRELIRGEVAKDLAEMPVSEIQKVLLKNL